jgi:FeS assembly SUF system protein
MSSPSNDARVNEPPTPAVPDPVPAPAAPDTSVAGDPQPVSEPLNTLALKPLVIEALCQVYDPEIPVNIYDLGLIYDVTVDASAMVDVRMTLTAPGCPVAGEMPNMVRDALLGVPGIGEVTVNMTFDPPWTPDRMSEEAKLELNMF